MEVTRNDVIEAIKRRQGSQSLRQFALSLGMSVAYLSDVYRGQRDIGPRLLKCFGFRKEKSSVVTYHRLRGQEQGCKR